MADVVLHNVPNRLLEPLRDRAARNKSSIEGEILTILDAALTHESRADAIAAASAIHDRLTSTGRSFSDSVELLREDRER